MPPLTFWNAIREKRYLFRRIDRRIAAKLIGVIFLIVLISVEIGPVFLSPAYAQITALNHTASSVDSTCREASFSADSNPFALCPGPFPRGGNCLWWAWEQWHLLGYDLPRNWGNAADWIADAKRGDLPLGTTPRVGAIAIFPVADGVWSLNASGHVAFVTAVNPDGSLFNVTYQNYGDPASIHVGIDFPVSLINQPRFQGGKLRFMYFPRLINPSLFVRLPGIGSNDLSGVTHANSQLINDGGGGIGSGGGPPPGPGSSNQLALGLPLTSTDQEYNADFAGLGLSDLLLYNRVQGTLKVLSFANEILRLRKMHVPHFIINEILSQEGETSPPELVSLSDKTTSANGWGSALDIHIGDFTGADRSEILLYDRVSGKLQLLLLTPELTIQKHVIFAGWGPGWEPYVGSLDGHHSDVFMYNRVVNAVPVVGDTGPTPTPTPTNTPVPTSTPSTHPTTTPTVVSTPTPKPSPTASPTPKPSPTPQPSPDPTLTPRPTPSPTPHICGIPIPVPAESTVPWLKLCPSPTPCPKLPWKLCFPTPTFKVNTGQGLVPLVNISASSIDGLPLDYDLSSTLSGATPPVLASNVIALSFDQNFNIAQFQQYTLMDNAWEIYVGRFVSSSQDALLLYDRMLGEMRLLSFGSKLRVVHYQAIHSVNANWEVHSGDFMGAGRAQVLLYDPSTGDAEFLILKPDLTLANTKMISGFGINQVLYTGHFGAATLSVMLYDSQAIQSTFYAFDTTLGIAHQVTVSSWDNHWQVLIGAFLDRSRCLASNNCLTGDDILALDRRTGQMEQFVFSFGNQYQVVDNRSQGFVRNNIASSPSLTSVDTTTFSLLATLSTSVRGEEF